MRLPRFTKPYHLKDYKFNLVVLVIALSILGVLAVGSAKEVYQSRQIVGMIIGIIAMVIVSLIDYVWVLNFYWIIYGFVVLILGAVLVIGDKVNGATRWIDLGFTTFQPSELAKILLILFFAKFIMMHAEDINDKVTLIKYAILSAIPLALIIVEPNLSTTICTALVICLMIYIGGLSYKFIGTVLLILVPVAIIFLSIVVQPDQKLLKDYQQKRILAFLEPEKYESDEAYQQKNSVMAIGSGQLYGKGLFNESLQSVKNGQFLMEEDTDFIFAVVGEELGFAGSCILIALFTLLVLECLWLATRARDLSGRLICVGMASFIAFQAFVNIGVATMLLPNTGLPLPFISSGLSSLLSVFIGLGFVMNVGLQRKSEII